MADIQPFRAFRYGDARLKTIGKRVCPPYDIISPAQQDRLYGQGGDNFIRVELTKGTPGKKYALAAATWKEWLKEGVIARDPVPALYVYQAVFKSQADGRKLARLGFFAALKAVPWGQGVFPHEKTLPTHKVDRLRLFKALKVQTSPIQCLFGDKGSRAMALLRKTAKGDPWLAYKDEAGVEHRFWRVTEPGSVERFRSILKEAPVVIADGHHRYETTLAYAGWARKKGFPPASDHVMALFNPSGDPALEILPTHRSVPWEKRRFVNLEKWGELLPVSGLGALRPMMLGKEGSSPAEVGVYRDGKFYRYRFTAMPAALKGTAHARLAVAVLHGGALDGLGKEDFFFTRRPEDAVAHAKKTGGWAFFLAPNTVKEVLGVATAGKVMPPKSTYFYPKIPSGIVSHALAGGL